MNPGSDSHSDLAGASFSTSPPSSSTPPPQTEAEAEPVRIFTTALVKGNMAGALHAAHMAPLEDLIGWADENLSNMSQREEYARNLKAI